ncbi:MAG: dodecin family protein [Rhodoplanes sp.]
MSLYRVVRLIGSSSTSWEDAAKSALEEDAKHLEDLRVAEIEQLDIRMQDNKVIEYRAAFGRPSAITRRSVDPVSRDIDRDRDRQIGGR